MAFADSGTAGFSGNAVATAYSGVFIPTLWSGKILEKFYDSTVLGAIANTDYEGEISSMGDKVVIRQVPTLTINDYNPDASLDFERPSSAKVELLIDQAKYFAAIVDDIYKVQSDLDMLSMWSDDAGEQMKIKIDETVLDGILTGLSGINTYNKGATAGRITQGIDLGVTTSPITITTANVVDQIVLMGQVLDEQNIPESGRWLVIPAWMASRIKRSELRDASLSGDGTSMLRNGRLGMIDRFTLYSSNLLPDSAHAGLTTSEFAIYAGHKHGLTFASQLTNVETLRAQTTFGTMLRGLQVFGYKVTDGTSIAVSVVTPG